VLHFDKPEDETAYTHRSGRTARAGATGLVVSFVSPADHRDTVRMQRRLDLPVATTDPDIESLPGMSGRARKEGRRVAAATPVTPKPQRSAPGGRRDRDRDRRRKRRV
jgi:superfamily II DNA/RNA helicase